MAKFGCVKSWMLSDDIVASIILHGQSFTLESIELLGQPKLQIGEEKKTKENLFGWGAPETISDRLESISGTIS